MVSSPRIKRDVADQTHDGDKGRYTEERQAYWDQDRHHISAEDITDWERCNDLIMLVSSEGNRRALWHGSISKVGGRSFVKWCRSEGIHEETGRRPKDRAILTIETQLARTLLQNNQTPI